MTAPYLFWGVLTTTIIALLALRGQIMRHRFYEYIHGGYVLLKKEPKLYIIMLVISLGASFMFAPPPFFPPMVWMVFGLICTVASLAVSWAYPLYLLKVEKNEKISTREWFTIAWPTFVRILPQMVVFVFLFFISFVLVGAVIGFIVVFAMFAIADLSGANPPFSQPVTEAQLVPFMLGGLIFGVCTSMPLLFSSFLFSLEKWSVWKSMKKSVRLVFSHKLFVSWYMVVELIAVFLTLTNPWKASQMSLVVVDVVSVYVQLIGINAVFLYYRKNIQPHITGSDTKVDVQRAEA